MIYSAVNCCLNQHLQRQQFIILVSYMNKHIDRQGNRDDCSDTSKKTERSSYNGKLLSVRVPIFVSVLMERETVISVFA